MRSRARFGRTFLTTAATIALLTGQLAVPDPARAEPGPGAPKPNTATTKPDPTTPDGTAPGTNGPSRTALMPQLDQVPPVNPAPGSVRVDRGPSAALTPIAPLPAVDPAAGAVAIDRAPVVPDPPVRPAPLTLPLHPGQELVDATAADAITTLDRAGRLHPDRTPDLDARKLQPQVSSAQFVDPAQPVTLEALITALASGNIPPPLPVDPLALLEQLPDGIPRITYRICSESATKTVSCSLTLPLAVPAIVDVTGDGTPDVLADLLPVALPGDVVAAVRQLLEVQSALKAAQDRLAVVLELLKDPLQVILHPELLLERLRLQDLIADLQAQLADKLEALLDLINVGVALLALRLPTSELAGQPLPAHVWAVYDIPGHQRISVGFDGLRRGTTLPTGTLGLFTFNPVTLLRGVYDIQARLLQGGAGDALAVTAGLASVTDDSAGDPYQPTVASARFSPVPSIFSARARIDPGSDTTHQHVLVDSTSDKATQLDVQVLSNRDGVDEFTQLVVDELPTSVSVELTRPSGGKATLAYRASTGIDRVLFADFGYQPAGLVNAVQASAEAIPASFDAALANTDTGVDLDYTASSQLAALDVAVYDKAGGLVGRGSLRKLPTAVTLTADTGASHVAFNGAQPLGSGTVAISRNLGAFAPYDSDHATLVTAGTALGVSARVTGMRQVDAYYDGHPRLATTFDPGGQPFVAAGDLDGLHKARLELSNLPATASLDVDTAARTVAYQTSSVIHRVFAAYTNTAAGPTLFATVTELPARINLSYDLGDRPRLHYQATSRVQKVEVFASPAHVETLRPQQDHYLSAAAAGLATTMDFLLDLPARHLDGTQSDPLTSLAAVVRLPSGGRDWTAMADLTGVPARFDADFAEGTYRFRGLSGPLSGARLAVTNHADQVAPTGLHLGVHYRQVTGDLDGSVSVRNLSWVEYARDGGGQTFRLDTDTGGDPVFVDADVLLAANGVDDTQLAAVARVDGLPNTIRSTFADGRLSYTATGHLGLTIGVRVGKVGALAGLGAPLFANGVALVGNGCDTGNGCARDESVFCTVFARCLGLVGTVRLPGLPSNLAVDTRARTVVFTGYRPPAAPLQAYLRLAGLVDSLPDVRALASLSGLPAELDMTVGPVEVAGGSIDFRYTASAPLGSLRFDADVTTTDQAFPVVRGRATIGRLPATMHVNGTVGDRTTVAVRNSAAVDSVGLTVTNASTGYLTASVTGVPATVDALVDLPARHAETTMSAPISAISFLAHVPYGGRTWSAFADVRGVPARFDADWGNGTYAFRAAEGSSLGSAAFAVTNHATALAPAGSHLATHYDEANGNIDGSASISGLQDAEFGHSGSSVTASYHAQRQTIALDGDVRLAAGGAQDVRLGALGRLGPIPGTITFSSNGGVINYAADATLDVETQFWLGKVAALDGLGAPRYANGASVVDRGCTVGPGCANQGPFCVDGKCFGLTGIINVSGLPSRVTVDPTTRSYSFAGYQPRSNKLTLYVDDSVFVPSPPDRIRAEATLTDLPSGINFTLGPIALTDTLSIKYDSDVASAGILDVHAQADQVPKFESTRALAHLDPIPGGLEVSGKVGSPTSVRVKNSTVIDDLSIKATGTFRGEPATGQVQLRDVPTDMTFSARGFGNAEGDNLPTVDYTANDGRDTLDIDVEVEANLVKKTDDFEAGPDDLELHITNLGHRTTVELAPDTQVVTITSVPKTDELQMVGNLHLSVSRKEMDLEFFNCFGLVRGLFTGHAEVGDSWISDITFNLTDIQAATLRPGNVRTDLPFGLPRELGYLFLAFDGTFGQATMSMAGVHLDLDIELLLRIDKIVGPDFFKQDLKLVGLYDSVDYHRYDLQQPSKVTVEVSTWGIPLAEIVLAIWPGLAEKSRNGVTVPGGRPSVVTMLDPGDDVDDYIFDLLAYAAWPFDGEHAPKQENTGDGGAC
ncbi:hypothetical protein [Micromonospora sp. CB01531]|uniref:hypothetical protein n=1 Tax=Micromonospora sp. CB01531 TaxID=1718947 RepID=UPI000938FD2C|nr:hypothetical protein [Micromonospora sp. CB01531]OKI57966.1 hypothetical protein A6A27_06910 [Micromonospora sp. CB01531]